MPSASQQIQSEAAITKISIWIQPVRLRFDGTVQEYLASRLFKFPPHNLVVQLLYELTKQDSPFGALRGLSCSQLKVYKRLDKNNLSSRTSRSSLLANIQNSRFLLSSLRYHIS